MRVYGNSKGWRGSEAFFFSSPQMKNDNGPGGGCNLRAEQFIERGDEIFTASFVVSLTLLYDVDMIA